MNAMPLPYELTPDELATEETGFDGLAPAGLYVFDIEVTGIAPYDKDWLRSRTLIIDEHEIIFPAEEKEQEALSAHALYILRDNYPASKACISVYDSDFNNLINVNGTTITIPKDDPVDFPQDVNEVSFTLPHFKFQSPYPFTFVFWVWDGALQSYKNHTAKTAFTNRRLSAPLHGHFVAGGLGGLGEDMKGWFIENILEPYLSQGVKRYLPDRFNRWRWRRAYLTYYYWVWKGPNTQPYPMDPVQEWNKDKVLEGIGNVEILTLMAHGNYDRMGRSILGRDYDIVTSDMIRNRYGGYWTYWDPIARKKENRQGLHHLRVVLVIGCHTGGEPSGEIEMESTPAKGSIADTFYSLGAKIVIYSQGEWGPAHKNFVKLFYQYATEYGMPIVEAAIKAREELMGASKNVSNYYSTVVNIRLIKQQGAENLYLAP